MRQVLLLGTNFVRTQRLTLMVMSVYLLGIAGVFSYHPEAQGSSFFLKMHAFYLVAVGMMVTATAVQTEQKSRRILAVLAKGIYRWQYLGGILCGSAIISLVFCAIVGSVSLLLCTQEGCSPGGLLALMAALYACCVFASAVGLFYSTFLNPFLATGAAALTLALPYVTERAGARLPKGLFPASWLVNSVLSFQFGDAPDAKLIVLSAVGFAILFWLAAAATFARRDVTISPE